MGWGKVLKQMYKWTLKPWPSNPNFVFLEMIYIYIYHLYWSWFLFIKRQKKNLTSSRLCIIQVYHTSPVQSQKKEAFCLFVHTYFSSWETFLSLDHDFWVTNITTDTILWFNCKSWSNSFYCLILCNQTFISELIHLSIIIHLNKHQKIITSLLHFQKKNNIRRSSPV